MHDSSDVPTLFSPARLGAVQLPNRIAMAPMTRNRAGEGNRPGPMVVEYYRQRASAGLIITEASQVTPEGQGYPNTPGIHSDEQVDAWHEVTEAVHSAGGRIALQLWHVGRISHPSVIGGLTPVAPSAIRPEGEIWTGAAGTLPFVTPRALELEEIPGVIRRYAEGARRARAAGFDAVEVHAANGYLVDQFLRDGSNRRTDRYGGPVENRARFLLEVTEAVSREVGADRVGVRLSPTGAFNSMHDSDPARTFGYAARALSRLGLAWLHLYEPIGPAWLVPALKAEFGGPVIANGGFDRASAEAVLQRGEAEVISFAVAFLANPDLPARLRAGAPLNTPDRGTFYGGGAEGYIDYPSLSLTRV